VRAAYPKPDFDSDFSPTDWNVFGQESRLWQPGTP
jgi:hypothetical protein